MRDRAYRCLPIAILVVFALLLVLPAPAAAGENAARGGAVWHAPLPPQAASCGICKAALERCSIKCLGADKAEMGSCMRSCDNAAAACTACDDEVTLRSEDVVARMPWLAKDFEKTAACHSTTPCDYNIYGSCAGWSGYTDCDDPFCGFGAGCGEDCPEIGPCPGPAMKQRRERYRVCFDPYNNSCTEYQRTTLTLDCGC
jgi:hypothetical protein